MNRGALLAPSIRQDVPWATLYRKRNTETRPDETLSFDTDITVSPEDTVALQVYPAWLAGISDGEMTSRLPTE